MAGRYDELPAGVLEMVGDVPDPWWNRPGWRWRARRLLDPRAHRWFVGGAAGSGLPWREAARFQLDFLLRRGLHPESVLLDVGCGSLRGGIHFIDYLAPGRYLGIDVSAEAVYRGITRELGTATLAEKRPEFVISGAFAFDRFSQRPDVAFANSVFTHLPPPDVSACLGRLRHFVGETRCDFYATFREVADGSDHDGPPHYLGGKAAMTYTRAEMAALGEGAGWEAEYIGPWGHPKNDRPGPIRLQMMMRFAT